LQFLPDKCQTALADLEHIVDAKMSRLKVNSQVEMEQFRQSVYINFCTKNHIPNPCGSKPGYERVIACFIEKLMSDHNLRSATVCGYVEGINKLFN
jgi:hypothetical protein